MPKIFISYSTKDKHLAGKLKKHFQEYDSIDCFVAHDDIIPGSEWEQEILANLESADYFMPLQTSNLENSFWCQQEVGFAIARNIKVIPIMHERGTNPIGFYAKYQGLKIKLDDIQRYVRRWLVSEGIIGINKEKSDELKKRIVLFEESSSFAEAGTNTRLLLQLEEIFSKSDIAKIVEASIRNEQILNSWDARKQLKPFFVKHAKIISKDLLSEFLKAE